MKFKEQMKFNEFRDMLADTGLYKSQKLNEKAAASNEAYH